MHGFMLLLTTITIISANLLFDINTKKEKLLAEEGVMMLGTDIYLKENEVRANEIIMEEKLKELDEGFYDPQNFYPNNFFKRKDEIKNTTLYHYIKKMPKGALLHAHDTGMLGPDYLVKLTYMKDLFVCFYEDKVSFYFSKTVPKLNTVCPCHSKWKPMKDARYGSGNVQEFDKKLRQYFVLNTDVKDGDVNTAWERFQNFFYTTGSLLQYKPVWEMYYNDTLKVLRRDGIMYLELRSVLPQLYDLDGNVFGPVVTAESYKTVTEDFMAIHPDFLGARLIYAPLRKVDKKTFLTYLNTAKELKSKMPDFFAGFDLVGQEDLGNTLSSYMPELAEAGRDLNYYLHAGETNWNGMSSDENLFDAIALGTKRIGHGFSIIKHPVLMQEIKRKKIPLEVNVISNMVLKLLSDIRNHPLANWLAQDLPIVLTSDDPGLWEVDPLTFDFYVVFLGVANKNSDLKLLKKLALNSLEYSSHPHPEKLVEEFEVRWEKFIKRVVRDAKTPEVEEDFVDYFTD